MIEERPPIPGDELDSYVAAYEAAQAEDAPVDLRAFLPGPDHPLRGAVLRELVRVDLEYGWARGRPRSLEDYRREFPELFATPEDLRAITFEEYRLRRQAGESPVPEDYQRRFGVDVSDWPASRPPSLHTTATPATVVGSGALSWFVRAVGRTDPRAARQLTRALAGMPETGTQFLGFHLIAELGRGTLGRVYLARQGELAGRPVALKVSGDVLGESRTLAQLQHTNVIPIFSVHHASPFHAVCMPFLGATTLEHVLQKLRGQKSPPESGRALVDAVNVRKSLTLPVAGCGDEAMGSLKTLGALTYVQAVLWIAARLADGLAHAHERGIVHRDLKPANILLADDGQPVLLDFNLSEDTKLRCSASAALVGGTLPYMAPEQLTAFQRRAPGADPRSDLYSLGVILYELLTGRHPFPVHGGTLEEMMPRMIEDRLAPPPRLCPGNPAVSPAVESVVRHCLEAEPARRYQTARQLHEDLERHWHDLPLRHAREPSPRERARKWARRHPRLTSATSVAVLAVALLLGLGALLVLRSQRLGRLEAVESFGQFRQEMREAQVVFLEAPTGQATPAEVSTACRRPLDRYRVLDDPDWQQAPALRRLPPEDRERLRADACELLFLLAALAPLETGPAADPALRDDSLRGALELNRRAESCYPADGAPAALLRQRAALEQLLGRQAEADRFRAKAEATPLRTPRDYCLLACTYATQGRFGQALPLWERASSEDPQNVWTWYGLGNCYDRLARPAQAAACYSACIALSPTVPAWYFRRGLAHLEQGEYRLAGDDFDQVIRLRPADGEAHVNRALARLGEARYAEAIDDLTRALELGAPAVRVYLIRAQAREKAGDRTGAERDRAAGLASEPENEASWVARGVARLPGAPGDALDDFDAALRANPRSLAALESKAHVLAERLGRTEEAVRALDQVVILYPEYGPARAARAVLLARLGEREAALRDARAALANLNSPALLYQVAGAYALTSRQQPDDRRQALALLASALRQGYGHDLIGADHDLDALRDDPQFQSLLEATKALRPGSRGSD